MRIDANKYIIIVTCDEKKPGTITKKITKPLQFRFRETVCIKFGELLKKTHIPNSNILSITKRLLLSNIDVLIGCFICGISFICGSKTFVFIKKLIYVQ